MDDASIEISSKDFNSTNSSCAGNFLEKIDDESQELHEYSNVHPWVIP